VTRYLLRLTCIKGVADPVDLGLPLFFTDGNYIKPAGLGRIVRPELKKLVGGPDNPSLLGEGHTFGPAAVAGTSPETDFREDQGLAIEHHKINLTQSAIEVSFQRPEPAHV